MLIRLLFRHFLIPDTEFTEEFPLGNFSSRNNISSLNSQSQLINTRQYLTQSILRLFPGKRVNSRADDAACLMIADSDAPSPIG